MKSNEKPSRKNDCGETFYERTQITEKKKNDIKPHMKDQLKHGITRR